MRGKWLLFGGSVILLAIAAGALSLLRKPAAAPVPKKAEAPKPIYSPGDEITLSGKLEAAHVVPVPAPIDGTLDSWDVEIGQDVLQGQVLGRVKNLALDAADEQARLELERAQTRVTNIEAGILSARLEAARADGDAQRARADADQAEKAYNRLEFLYKEGAAPRLKFEEAQKNYQQLKLEAASTTAVARQATEQVAKLERDLELAKKTLEDRQAAQEETQADLEASTIIAPVDGTVLSRKVEPGGEVSRTLTDLVQLAVDPALMHAVAEPEPAVLKYLQAGQPALVTVVEVSDEGLPGEVKEVGDSSVVVEFTSPNPAIKHGMIAGIRIKLVPVEPPPASN